MSKWKIASHISHMQYLIPLLPVEIHNLLLVNNKFDLFLNLFSCDLALHFSEISKMIFFCFGQILLALFPLIFSKFLLSTNWGSHGALDLRGSTGQYWTIKHTDPSSLWSVSMMLSVHVNECAVNLTLTCFQLFTVYSQAWSRLDK